MKECDSVFIQQFVNSIVRAAECETSVRDKCGIVDVGEFSLMKNYSVIPHETQNNDN